MRLATAAAVTTSGRDVRILAAELAAMALTATLLAWASRDTLSQLSATGSWWIVAPAGLLGCLLSDLASGLLHWFCDTFFEERTPLLGRLVIAPFREHHRDPQGIVRHGFLELHGNSCVAAFPALLAALSLPPDAGTVSLFARVALLCLAAAAAATNQFHRWAHAADVPAFARWLQRQNLILSPDRHDRHHRGGFTESYCMTNGWMSGLLDASGLLPAIANAARRLHLPNRAS